MHGLTYIVVSSEREAQVADTATDMRPRQIRPDPFRSPDEVGSIGIMLLHASGNGEDIGVEDDVEGIHAHLLRQDPVGPPGYLDTSLVGRGLPLFVEAHHHHCSPVAHHIPGMLNKLLLALFQRDGVHDALALHTLQTGLDDLPVAGVDHHRYTRDIRLCGNHVQEGGHLLPGIEQTVVHIDIYHEGTVSHLLSGDADGLVVILLLDQSQELP